MANRTVLHICCSAAEARIIHFQAEGERRTVSAYVLGILDRVLRLEEGMKHLPARPRKRSAPIGPRTSILVRCSIEESHRVHLAAARKGVAVSTFVLDQLRRAWKVRGLP